MPGILDFVRMEQSETYRETEWGENSFQPFYINYQQVQPIRNAFYRVHASPDCEMILPRERSYRCLLDGNPVKVRRGEFLIIQANQRHQDLFSTESPYHTFHFLMRGREGVQALGKLFSDELPPQQQAERIPDPELVETILGLLRKEVRKPSRPETFHLCNSLFRSIFWNCISAYPPSRLSDLFRTGVQNNQAALHLIRVFERNVTEMPSLDALCRESGMSRSALNRLTNAMFALPPKKAFLKYKIGRAQQLLTERPELKIKEVSDFLHFENQFHFSRIFKQYAQYPPSRHSGRKEEKNPAPISESHPGTPGSGSASGRPS